MEASVVTAGLLAAETAMKDTLAKAESDLKALGPESFVESKLTSLGRLISIYHDCFVELDVKSRDEMNGICSKKSENEAVTEAYDDLLNTEVDWNKFLVRVDDLVSKDIDESNADFHSILVQDARTDNDTFTQQNTRILLISFGTQKGAQRWLAETGSPYPMLLDPDRKLYHAFGLRQSIAKVWSTSALTYYAEQKRLDRRLHSLFEDDDPNQLGGDFVVTQTGQVALSYPSKSPTDRPTIANLLAAITRK